MMYQCERRLRFADAGCMYPGERAYGANSGGLSLSFRKSFGMFFTLGHAAVQVVIYKRAAQTGDAAIQG
jgi:hypothetical protein